MATIFSALTGATVTLHADEAAAVRHCARFLQDEMGPSHRVGADNWEEMLSILNAQRRLRDDESLEVAVASHAHPGAEGPAHPDDWAPTPFQIEALLAYGGRGEFAHIAEPMSKTAFDEELAGCGDTLLRAIVAEMDDDCESRAEAVNRLSAMIEDITLVRDDLFKKEA